MLKAYVTEANKRLFAGVIVGENAGCGNYIHIKLQSAALFGLVSLHGLLRLFGLLLF